MKYSGKLFPIHGDSLREWKRDIYVCVSIYMCVCVCITLFNSFYVATIVLIPNLTKYKELKLQVNLLSMSMSKSYTKYWQSEWSNT